MVYLFDIDRRGHLPTID